MNNFLFRYGFLLASCAIALVTSTAEANTIQSTTLQGTYDQALNGDLVFQRGATPFYLDGPNALSTIDVTGTVDVSGLSAGGGSSVVYVGVVQSNTNFVLFEPRLQAGYLGTGTGWTGQGGSNPGENAQNGNVALDDPSNVPVNITFGPSSFTAEFLDANSVLQPVTQVYNADASITPSIDPLVPVYPFVLAFNTTADQTASWNVTFTQVVPEPASLALLGIAFGTFLAVGRRRRS